MDSVRQAPCLIVGMPRSGTSWLAKIYDSHPGTLYRHEPDSVRPIRTLPIVALRLGEVRAETIRNEVFACLRARSSRIAGPRPVFAKRFRPGARGALYRSWYYGAKAASQVFGPVTVPDLVSRRATPGPRIVWKSVEAATRIGALAEALPEARIVFIVRHPCGQIASVVRGLATDRFARGAGLGNHHGILGSLLAVPLAAKRGVTPDALSALSAVERAAYRWLLSVEAALVGMDGRTNCMTMRYEDLCGEPERATRALFEFSGLDWNDQTARFLAASTHQDDSQYYSVFKNPLRAANRWRDEMRPADVRAVTEVVRESAAGALYGIAGDAPRRSAAGPAADNDAEAGVMRQRRARRPLRP